MPEQITQFHNDLFHAVLKLKNPDRVCRLLQEAYGVHTNRIRLRLHPFSPLFLDAQRAIRWGTLNRLVPPALGARGRWLDSITCVYTVVQEAKLQILRPLLLVAERF